MRKPKVFIGSSRESKKIVDDLERALFDSVEIHRWDRDVFHAGQVTLDELAQAAAEADFAIFVIGRDDVTDSRNVTTPSPRDNVIFEAGLFCGVLGRSRVFYVVDDQGTKLPSDWGGVSYLPFDAAASRPRDRVYHAMIALQERFDALKSRNSASARDLICGRWWQMVLNTDSGSVLGLLEIRPGDGDGVFVQGTAWGVDGKKKAAYRSISATFNAKKCLLSYYWEGDHPQDRQMMPAFGIANITFESDGERAETGDGFFTTTNPDLAATVKKNAAYWRAIDAEFAVIKGTDAGARAALIQSKLAKRDDFHV